VRSYEIRAKIRASHVAVDSSAVSASISTRSNRTAVRVLHRRYGTYPSHLDRGSEPLLRRGAIMNESWQYTRQGLPSETLEKVTSEIPIPSSEEIIVQIKALSINPVDYKL
jgi:hypothetical protein